MKVVYIFEEQSNPSTDYYIIPAFSEYNFSICRINQWNEIYPDIEKESWIIIIRYLNKKLVNFLKQNRRKLERLIYFMDDGLMSLGGLRDLPVKYAFRIFKKAYVYKNVLRKLKSEMWVSTDYLSEVYKEWNPTVIYPYPLDIENDINLTNHESPKIIFYHGTSSHKKEIRWLSSLVNEISEKYQDVVFEIILNDSNFKYFKHFKNIISLRPMRWESYFKFCRLKYRTIGLVPLFNYEFNRGRSWIKFYDITRAGAVGIYSEHAPYAEIIKKFNAGLVIPMNIEAWVEAIHRLISSQKECVTLLNNSMNLAEHLKNNAVDSYKKAISIV